ncbi:hypothetical protein QBC36DRAFT_355409 [Triangularia setosa]|uniref:Uncharacterized protein n=1 Tax=Triangularia setosa TaxID=2587417 RepID=A0AAN7A4L2_9PEZI|nr:hypothetical protein QBC36DRAFT_355409 [Podospora setosa]
MLGAFLTPSYRDWWLGYAARPRDMNPLHGHWLVRRSVASTFANRDVRLQKFSSLLVEFRVEQVAMKPLAKPTSIRGLYPAMVHQSRNNLVKVDARFIGMQARLASSIQLVAISQEHGPEVPTSSMGGKDRLKVCELLRRFGKYLYPTQGSASVTSLPFGLYLKQSNLENEVDRIRNETKALRLVQKHTDVPVLRPLNVVCQPSGRQVAYLLMIPNTANKAMVICNTLIGPIAYETSWWEAIGAIS